MDSATIENNRAFGYPYFWLACALSLKGREKEAREALATFETITPTNGIPKIALWMRRRIQSSSGNVSAFMRH
jgi:hypothetical protein